ncbi:MAG: cupin domain-containing protein [Lysobacter sp.]
MNAKSTWSSVAVLLAVMASPQAQAQDPGVVAPDIYKCTFENEHTRLCEITFGTSKKIAPHSHPAHLVYVLQPGKLRITDDGTGESADVDFAVGQSVWIPAVTHHAENIGDTEVKAVIVEFKKLKDAPKAKDKPGKK